MEGVAVDLQCIFAGKDGKAAMRALSSEADSRDRVAAAGAPVTALEARTREEFFGYSAHYGETHGARKREAGVTESFASRAHEYATRDLGRHHPRPSLESLESSRLVSRIQETRKLQRAVRSPARPSGHRIYFRSRATNSSQPLQIISGT